MARRRARRKGWTKEEAAKVVAYLRGGVSIRAAARLAGVGRGQIEYALREWESYAGRDGGGSTASRDILDFGRECSEAMGEFALDVVEVVRAQSGRRPAMLARYFADGIEAGFWEAGDDPQGEVLRWSRFVKGQEETANGLDLGTLEASDGGD